MHLHLRNLLPLYFLALAVASSSSSEHDAAQPAPIRFDPSSFPQKIAKCRSINRKENSEKEIDIQYVEVNPDAKKTIIMAHGWPGLWTSWIHQIREFQDEYHILAPNHRGFGGSTHPGDTESSATMYDLVGDLVCVLENAGVDRAICLGHDWGAQICWEAARLRPDVFEAVAAAAIPYLPSAGWFFIPTWALIWRLPHLAYQHYFQTKTTQAIEELNKDIRRSIRAVYRTPDSRPPPSFLKSKKDFLKAFDGIEIPPSPFLTQEEEDYLVQQYSIQGFNHTLQFYTYGNRYGSWKFANLQGNHTIHQPALAIYPTLDTVADWQKLEKMLGSAKYLPQLTVDTLPTAHWIQLEKPVEFNAILRKWLDSLSATKEETPQQHLADEL